MAELKFKTEVQELLHLMIHALYSNKDIFLRELVSNAADAVDKARFLSLSNPEVATDWKVKIIPDKEKGTITIIDNGIGMTQEELVENIGTIAKSGTKAFLNNLKQTQQANVPELIGQFGVGFYSAFMVAEKVEIFTKKAGDKAAKAVHWTSEGKDSFVIEDCERYAQGTEIILHLNGDSKNYLESWKIREIIKKYSDYIEHPIVLVEKDEKGEVKEDTLNSMKAIWLRNPSEITEDEYKQFYTHLSHYGSELLKHIHYSAEGKSEFKSLLFLPAKAPMDIFSADTRKKGLHLYVKRIFITDDCPGILPDYLRFVKGVVDSADLPLNISREMLQDNPQITKINKSLTSKLLSEFKKLLENEREKYEGFFKEFGKIIKEGLHTDFTNKEKIQDIVLFESMKNAPGKLITLKEYRDAMPEAQKEIYYIIGEDRNALENSPHLEAFKSRGYDVLFMTDGIDEWVVQSLLEYDTKHLKAVGKGDIDFGDDTAKAAQEKTEKATQEHKTLLEALQKKLDEKVKEVRFSKRLTDSACCLVSDEFDPGVHMERLMKALNQAMPSRKRILELNPDHPIVSGLQKLYDKSPDDARLADFAGLLYDQALLTEGSPVPDPLNFAKKLANLMAFNLEKGV